jgi:ABC-type Fe3+/spermidine/putrescine transport system ATPase subunit
MRLMPWLTVRKTLLAVLLQMAGLRDRRSMRGRRKYVALVGLTAAGQKKPSALSDDMKQRLDVPDAALSSPDAAARRALRTPVADARHDPGRADEHRARKPETDELIS